MMTYYTPLRYPGGKRRLAAAVGNLLHANSLRDVNYIEPYAGGASVALHLLFQEYASTIHINDLSRPIYSFWHSVLTQSERMCNELLSCPLSMDYWYVQKSIYENRTKADLFSLGFATLFLNRTNRSGIISGGVIGGKNQAGTWGLDARFNRGELVSRIRRVARYKDRIHLYNQDAESFTRSTIRQMDKNTFVFYDPPYIENGKDLYLNNYTVEGHKMLSSEIVQLETPWIVSYDYAATKYPLYEGHRRLVYRLPYSAQKRYEGKEVMFLSDNLRLPKSWAAIEMISLAACDANVPLWAELEGVSE